MYLMLFILHEQLLMYCIYFVAFFLQCFLQFEGDLIYNLRDSVSTVDPTTWDIVEVSASPYDKCLRIFFPKKYSCVDI